MRTIIISFLLVVIWSNTNAQAAFMPKELENLYNVIPSAFEVYLRGKGYHIEPTYSNDTVSTYLSNEARNSGYYDHIVRASKQGEFACLYSTTDYDVHKEFLGALTKSGYMTLKETTDSNKDKHTFYINGVFTIEVYSYSREGITRYSYSIGKGLM